MAASWCRREESQERCGGSAWWLTDGCWKGDEAGPDHAPHSCARPVFKKLINSSPNSTHQNNLTITEAMLLLVLLLSHSTFPRGSGATVASTGATDFKHHDVTSIVA